MNNKIIAFCFACILVGTTACTSNRPDTKIEREKIADVRNMFFQYETKKNFEGMRSLVTTNFNVVTSWGAVENMDSVEANLKRWNFQNHKIEPVQLKFFLSPDGQTAFELIRNNISVSAGSSTSSLSVYATLIYVKVDDDWKIMHETFAEIPK